MHCSVRVALSLLLVGWTTANIARRRSKSVAQLRDDSVILWTLYIVTGDCGCAGECVVYEEEGRFECLCSNYTPTSSDCDRDRSDSDCFYDYSGDGVCVCPNDTRLAPDLRDCYHSENNLLSS